MVRQIRAAPKPCKPNQDLITNQGQDRDNCTMGERWWRTFEWGLRALRQPAVVAAVAAALLVAAPRAEAGDNVAELAEAGPLPPPEISPQTRGRAVPSLPEVAPAPVKPPFSLPPVAPAAPTQKLSRAPLFVLRDVKIVGNTVLDEAAIRAIVNPYIDKPVSTADLEEMRRQFTMLYIKRGYINSGAVIPDQRVENGVVTFRFVEGRITGFNITGPDGQKLPGPPLHYSPGYFTARLQQAVTVPFNVADLEREQQILLQDPLVRRLNIELTPGLQPGEAKVNAEVLEGSPYALGISLANDQSPTVGEERGELHGSVANLLGQGDILAASYGRSQGINDGFVAYSLPILPDDTRVSIRYDRNGTLVVAPTLAPLNITSNYSSIAFGVSRPFWRTETQNLTLGLGLERRRAQSFLLGFPFSFTAGSVNGNTNVTALRFYQDWLDRDADHAFAVRSTFSFGLPIMGATIEPAFLPGGFFFPGGFPRPPGTPTGEFFSWLAQAQYVRRIFKDWEGVVRSDLQLSSSPLFPIEQFALGGLGTVRGYRTYLTVTDDAFLASGELRIPVAKLRIPRLSPNDTDGVVQLVPFYDYGRGWNVLRQTPYPPDLSSIGLGFRWLIGSGITAEAYYAKGLRHVPVGTSLEDRGILFRLSAAFF
jgi:hemolysin activation/secretion protein